MGEGEGETRWRRNRPVAYDKTDQRGVQSQVSGDEHRCGRKKLAADRAVHASGDVPVRGSGARRAASRADCAHTPPCRPRAPPRR
eukprot:614914-Pleurochrysis_carterae.AAC.1